MSSFSAVPRGKGAPEENPLLFKLYLSRGATETRGLFSTEDPQTTASDQPGTETVCMTEYTYERITHSNSVHSKYRKAYAHKHMYIHARNITNTVK